ncbi:carnitine O-palmitoyltransferase 1, liver isoform-like isoform X2 [Gigantopelta aegis]|uniref:carnitine O-palmitoyltransferase 1, liver isoform-like isoform X2 n=1 Tax=Gigantopelta aegis TaxID=1735272 RepID=UPI001B8886E0|nr:carnitine O-palmitoyltransferase 1, liver isoform-like isoform X2 [Gigantopelta aegis]
MAEAHAAVAFSFTVTPEGVNLDLNHEVFKAIWQSGLLSWKKRIGRMKNNFRNGLFPASPMSFVFTLSIVMALHYGGFDPSFGLIFFFQTHMLGLDVSNPIISYDISCALFAIIMWLIAILLIKYSLKALLTYHGWIYEVRGPISIKTKLWLGLVRLFGGRKPLLNSYQAALPKLPVPSIDHTITKFLESIHPIMDEEKYKRMEKLAYEFKNGIGKKLQRYLVLKSWWASNYVSDWWESYVYLKGRSSIMINSNFYGIDCVLEKPYGCQVARAASVIYSAIQYRRDLDREELEPLLLNKIVPLCSAQYERQFNTTRIPGIDIDTIVHLKDSNHVAVYHKGRYFKVYIKHKGSYLMPAEIESMLQKIVDDPSEPAKGEEHLAALTAGERVPWAKARTEYFSAGKNKASLHAIEKAAFCVTLDEESHNYDPDDPTAFDKYGASLLHGKGYDRWFDKSFTLVVFANGRIGFNAEHSWADGPIMAHFWEYMMEEDGIPTRYTADGHCSGKLSDQVPNPIRLEWDLPSPCLYVITKSLSVARQLINDVDLHVMMYTYYGKRFMKKCKVSPDAFIQMALQLTYYRSEGKFCLTYESSMTRLFREGRTETVRSCTAESCAFVRSMDDPKKTNAESIKLMQIAADCHQRAYREAMTGLGIDRHLFCLYVVEKYLGLDSPFLSEVLSEPWRLSTSQTPHQQAQRLDIEKYPNRICGGGGFGPVADDGYGVSYIVAGEDTVFFHISCKKSCSTTNANQFGNNLIKAFADMKSLFDESS